VSQRTVYRPAAQPVNTHKYRPDRNDRKPESVNTNVIYKGETSRGSKTAKHSWNGSHPMQQNKAQINHKEGNKISRKLKRTGCLAANQAPQ
jgi:hypothetical protein